MNTELELRQLTRCLINGDQPAAQRAHDRLSRSGQTTPAAMARAWEAGRDIRSYIERFNAMNASGSPIQSAGRDAAALAATYPTWQRFIALLPRRIAQGAYRLRASPKSITRLAATRRWRIAIDEVGTRFGRDATPSTRGKVVAIVWRDEAPPAFLPPNWHAVSQSDAARDRALSSVTASPVGVFGLSSDQVDSGDDGWVASVISLLCWTVLLAPLPPTGRVAFHVDVEQRAQYRPGDDWSLIGQLVQMRVERVDPERARRVSLHLRICTKGTPGLGLADVVAHSWGGPKPIGSERLRQRQLSSVLYELPRHDLGRVWAMLDRTRRLDVEAWRWLLTQPSPAGGPIDRARALIDQRLAEEPKTWRRALRASLAHLESKALNMHGALSEAEVLQRTRPPHVDLPPAMRLAECVGALARHNHLGGDPDFGDAPLLQEIQALSTELLPSQPALVCLADLHRAVQAFNQCDLDGAQAAIARWAALPPAIGGPQMRARVRSTQGQHHAFQADYAKARAAFDDALSRFATLDDPDARRGERAQTRTYLLHTLIDNPAATDAEVAQAMAAHLRDQGLTVVDLAGSSTAPAVWAHHLWVRFLVYRGQPEQRAAYRNAHGRWQSRSAWPWPALEAYRAIIERPRWPDIARDRLVAASVKANEEARHGPALWLVGAGLRIAAGGWGVPWAERSATLSALSEDFPGMKPWVERLAALADEGAEPARVLREGLPWGFR